MKRGTRWAIYGISILAVVVFFVCGVKMFHKGQVENTGIPDVVSSMPQGYYRYLIVVANCHEIVDKEEFARKVIHMCQQNSFHSVKFSTDIGMDTTCWDIIVYLNREEVKSGIPICEIRFETVRSDGTSDTKNKEDEFRLYLDGKEIEFY